MATKTKGSFFPTLIGLIAVSVVGYIIVVVYGQQPSGNENGDNQCTYLLTVTFNPARQDPAVSVNYSIAGGGTKTEAAETSPWQKSVPARCGSTIVLTAKVDAKYMITKNGQAMLNCSIKHGSQNNTDSAEPGEQSVHCSMAG